MCGRYGRRAEMQRIAEWMQTHEVGRAYLTAANRGRNALPLEKV